jgi:Protein of unknown function, DUF488
VFTNAGRNENEWVLDNAWGDRMILPFRRTGGLLRVGLLGTGAVRDAKRKTEAMAGLLMSLETPLYVLDTRRNGCGGQGSWAPREFASEIPDRMKTERPYCFVHLPVVAPSIEMLEWNKSEKPGWRAFRDHYDRELTPEAVRVAAAFVESAATRGGLAVLLCTEADVPGFRDAAPEIQEKEYCHRFTLARRIREFFSGLGMELQSISLRPDPRTSSHSGRASSSRS